MLQQPELGFATPVRLEQNVVTVMNYHHHHHFHSSSFATMPCYITLLPAVTELKVLQLSLGLYCWVEQYLQTTVKCYWVCRGEVAPLIPFLHFHEIVIYYKAFTSYVNFS